MRGLHGCAMTFVALTVVFFISFTGSRAMPQEAFDGHVGVSENFPKSRQRRVANGAPAPIESYPYMASVQSQSRHRCGGTIVTDRTVLTAAHCVSDDETYSVRVGSTSMESGGSEHIVLVVVRHEQYEPNSTVNDIALLWLDPPIIFDKVPPITKAPVQLFERGEQIEYGTDGVVIGWGATRNRREGDFDSGNVWHRILSIFQTYDMGHYFSYDLRYTTFKIVKKHMCSSYPVYTKNQICGFGGANHSCTRDSGGPLMVNGRQAGIIAWGASRCDSKVVPTGSTPIAAYRKWIDQNARIVTFHDDSGILDWFS